MGDVPYRNQNFILKSRGIAARSVDDTLPEGFWLNQQDCEELAENAMSCRLGTSIINRVGNAVVPLSGAVHSLAKLSSINGNAYRYAGAGGNLYRRSAAGQGQYDLIYAALSGKTWQSQTYGSTEFTSFPYIFFADGNGMLKDNGSLAAPQQMGIFQPQYPVSALALAPNLVPLDPAPGNGYATTGITGFSANTPIDPNTTLSSAVTQPGVQAVSVSTTPNPMTLFQRVQVGAETVLVLQVTANGFVANFTTAHAVGESVVGYGMQGSVSSMGQVNIAFAGNPISAWPKPLQQADYIGLQLFVSDPTDINQIILKFDCGDGTFQSDYFYKVIGQGPLQNLLNQANQPSTAATDAIVTEALGVYGQGDGSIVQLNVGQNVRTPILIQLSDFAGAGRADFNDPVFNWLNVNGCQVEIVTNSNTGESVSFTMTSLVLFGGYGPDTFAGVSYDYRFTFFNANDGTESNGSMIMTDVNPPLNTNRVYPRRQPVQLTLNLKTMGPAGQLQDGQITHVGIYRRGGVLGDNWRRIQYVPCNIAAGGTITYVDSAADDDIEGNDILSLTNDVPVTSSLPVPVNTTLNAALNPSPGGSVAVITPASMAGISVRQQVTIGTPGAISNDLETVIVLTVAAHSFTAWVQNQHAAGEQVTATAKIGQPVTIMAQAFGQFWFAGDPNNPHYLYYSPRNYPQYCGPANYVAVGSPDDPITCIVGYKGNLYVSTIKFWWLIAPGQNGGPPTVYPTAAKHGCVATNGFIVTEEAIFYQAIDGIRAFAGGASSYLTQDQEFIWQGVGSSPIVQANPNALSQTCAAYWNNMHFFSYVGVDGQRYRQIAHQIYKRWRNDSVPATAMLLEADTNTLVFGDQNGVVHIDRQNQAYDEGMDLNQQLTILPIGIDLLGPYSDQGMPSVTKSYQELTLDIDTAGQDILVSLYFEDGTQGYVVGKVNTTGRQKFNITLNQGLGYEFYKATVRFQGNVKSFIYIYQCSIKSLPLAKTRKDMDTFWMKLGTDESKVVKQVYFEYTSTQDAAFSVYYDGESVPRWTFTLPNSGGVRAARRFRLPAISCRMIRLIGASVADFQIWTDSKIEFKVLGTGKGYNSIEFVPD